MSVFGAWRMVAEQPELDSELAELAAVYTRQGIILVLKVVSCREAYACVFATLIVSCCRVFMLVRRGYRIQRRTQIQGGSIDVLVNSSVADGKPKQVRQAGFLHGTRGARSAAAGT